MSDECPTEILPTHTPELFAAAVERAAEALRAGELAALPTETVYGLAANALDAQAVARIFAVKGRPAHNPIIVHVCDTAMARRCAVQWTDAAEKLAAAFWPGPLTLVLPRAQEIPDAVTAGGGTVGIRWPSHPFIQAVIRACGFPLAAPSANLSNEISPTNAEHVQKSLAGKIPLIVDGGQSQVGIESTVIDVTRRPARVLRPGMIHLESLAAVLGENEVIAESPVDSTADSATEPLRSPGLLLRHYAPKARLLVFGWDNDRELDVKLANSPFSREQTHVIAHTRIPSAGGFGRVSVIPHDAEAFARALYAELHRCDEEGAQLIVAESVPDTAEWRAVADRLARAAA